MRFLDEVLTDAVAHEADTPAYIDATEAVPRTFTYRDWERAATGLAGAFSELGVARGDVVAVRIGPCFEYPVAYMAAVMLGAVMSGINPRLGKAEFADIIDQARPMVTILEQDEAPPAGAGSVLRRRELADLFAGDPAQPAVGRSDADIAAIVWTSGTTGHPKGAMYAHENLSAVAGAHDIIARRHDRYLAAVPFAHMGFMTKIWEHTSLTTTHVIAPAPWKAGAALALIEEHGITVAGGIPAQWRLMLDAPSFATTDLSSLRRLVLGGAFIEPELVRELQSKIGVPVISRYTCTEAALTTSTSLDDEAEVIANTVGKPVAGVDVELVDEDRRPAAPGTVGEIRCRSGAMMRGYWHSPDLTAAVVDADGWLYTGDLGTWDADGNLKIVGRRKDMYIRGGYNVYPAEIEARLSEHEAVNTAAVVGRPDPVLGEIGIAFVVMADAAASPPLQDLRSWVAETLADYKRPDRVEYVDAIPLTSLQKPDKVVLARLAREIDLD